MTFVVPRRTVFLAAAAAEDISRREMARLFLDDFDFLSPGVALPAEATPSRGGVSPIEADLRGLIRAAEATIVLIGPNTWRSRWIDWEIRETVRGGPGKRTSGLLGIYTRSTSRLPPAERPPLPPLLADNERNGFAVVYPWPEESWDLLRYVDEALMRRKTAYPDTWREPLLEDVPSWVAHP